MIKHYRQGVSAIALLVAIPALAMAQDKGATNVEGVLVTATRATDGVAADKIGSSVTVLTAEDMEVRQVRLVSDVLRDVPGFAVSRTGTPGNLTQVRVRGTEGNHVLTLIDGIEASDPFYGEFDYATLLADDVSRVEILRGPQSALYGSDAIAGVVNYITPTGKEAPGIRLRGEVGGLGTFGGAARIAGVRGALDYVVNGGYQSTDGYVSQTLPGGTRKLGSEMSTFSTKLNYKVSDIFNVKAVLRYTDTQADLNSSVFGRGLVDSPGNYYEGTSLYGYLGGDLSLLDGRWTHNLSIQGVDADRKGYTANSRSSGDKGEREKASYVTSYRLETGTLIHRFTGAVDYEKETYQNTSPVSSGADLTRRSIKNLGVVGQYDLELGPNAGIGGAVRHDDNDFFEDATTYKLQGYYRFTDAIRVRAATGTGIKNPSQTELFGYNATGPFPFRGNALLKPEKSKGWEVGADLTLLDNRLEIGATYFDAKLEDEIFSASRTVALTMNTGACPPPPAGTSTTCNRQTESTQKGVELWASLKLTDQLTVSGAYTHLNAKELGLEEIRRAPDIGSVNVTWKGLADKATVNLNVRYNGDQIDSNFSGINAASPPAGLPSFKALTAPNAGKVELPAYTLVNLSGSYRFTDQVEVYGRVENLMDENYYEVFSYPAAPRAAYVGVRLKY